MANSEYMLVSPTQTSLKDRSNPTCTGRNVPNMPTTNIKRALEHAGLTQSERKIQDFMPETTIEVPGNTICPACNTAAASAAKHATASAAT